MKAGRKMEETLTKAIDYLKSRGCEEVYLFGSMADGTDDEASDIDLAVSGISPREYFRALAILSSMVGHRIDMVLMDYAPQDLERKIRKTRKRVYAASKIGR